jgi:hypothetical protein
VPKLNRTRGEINTGVCARALFSTEAVQSSAELSNMLTGIDMHEKLKKYPHLKWLRLLPGGEKKPKYLKFTKGGQSVVRTLQNEVFQCVVFKPDATPKGWGVNDRAAVAVGSVGITGNVVVAVHIHPNGRAMIIVCQWCGTGNENPVLMVSLHSQKNRVEREMGEGTAGV